MRTDVPVMLNEAGLRGHSVLRITSSFFGDDVLEFTIRVPRGSMFRVRQNGSRYVFSYFYFSPRACRVLWHLFIFLTCLPRHIELPWRLCEVVHDELLSGKDHQGNKSARKGSNLVLEYHYQYFGRSPVPQVKE